MKTIKQYIPLIILLALLAWAICQALAVNDLIRDVKNLSEDVAKVTAERERLLQEQILSRLDSPVIALENTAAESEFIPIGVPLDIKSGSDNCASDRRHNAKDKASSGGTSGARPTLGTVLD